MSSGVWIFLIRTRFRPQGKPVIAQGTGSLQEFVNKYIGGFLVGEPCFQFLFPFDVGDIHFPPALHHFSGKGMVDGVVGISGFGDQAYAGDSFRLPAG